MIDKNIIEEWKDVIGYEGLYKVSSKGSVLSIARNTTKGGILRNLIGSSGRLQVNLYKNGKLKSLLVSRLVLIAFAGYPKDGEECCHNNGDPFDNKLINLRWDSRKNNHADKLIHGTAQRGVNNGMSKLTNEQVIEMRGMRNDGATLVRLKNIFKVSETTVSKICRRDSWFHI